jgi:hypothetical protein
MLVAAPPPGLTAQQLDQAIASPRGLHEVLKMDIWRELALMPPLIAEADTGSIHAKLKLFLKYSRAQLMVKPATEQQAFTKKVTVFHELLLEFAALEHMTGGRLYLSMKGSIADLCDEPLPAPVQAEASINEGIMHKIVQKRAVAQAFAPMDMAPYPKGAPATAHKRQKGQLKARWYGPKDMPGTCAFHGHPMDKHTTEQCKFRIANPSATPSTLPIQ